MTRPEPPPATAMRPPTPLLRALLSWIDAAMATAAIAFMDAWTRVERAYRRPFSRIALRVGFAFYPLLAAGAVGWLAWDWRHARSLDAAEDAIFDRVVQWRPVEPRPSGRVAVVEIDDCSIDYVRAQGDGGWPWPRQRHADLLDALDRAGVRAVGYDVLFADASTTDPQGDATLDAMAGGAGGRFVFASQRMDEDFDAGATLRAADAPGAFALSADARLQAAPAVAMVLPYGAGLARHSGITNVGRNGDGLLRDIALRDDEGAWAIPSLPLRLAAHATARAPASFPASVRPNWRQHAQLPYVSAADLLAGRAVCGHAADVRALRGAVALVGSTAASMGDIKPTPVNPAMPGVEVLAEATEALVAGSAIAMPPASLKYFVAAALVLLTTFAFWRGEPHEDIDSIFVATNLALLLAAFVGLTFFGVFFDIFASVGFISLCFGLCRLYAGVQRGRAVGNNDYLGEYDPDAHPWLVMARLRFVPDAALDARAAGRRRREYRRRLRRFLYAGREAVMIEGVVERKHWLHEILDDLMLLVWKGSDEASARAAALADLDALFVQLEAHDQRLAADGSVRVSLVAAQIDDRHDDSDRGERLRLRELLGRDLNATDEWPLQAHNTFASAGPDPMRPHAPPRT